MCLKVLRSSSKGVTNEKLSIMNKLEQFIASILETRKVWLLEAKEGFFAMLEDNDGESYIPLWESEDLARKAAQGDWEGYTVADMGFSELGSWLKELAADEIDIAVSPETDGEIYIACGNARPEPGQFIPVRIDSAEEYDLRGTML